MNAKSGDAGTITLHWFYAEELAVMEGCLQIAASNRFIHEDFISAVTGWTTNEFAAVLERFGKSPWINRDDFDAVKGAVFITEKYRGDKEPNAFKNILPISRLHLNWFSDRLQAVSDEWNCHVENSEEQNQLRQSLADEGIPDYPDF